jgi:hypothetical protein
MARPRRMGAYNALDELLPGPASERPRLEAVVAPARRRTPARGQDSEREQKRDRDRDQVQGRDQDKDRDRDQDKDRDREPERATDARPGPAFNALDELLPGPLAARPRLLQLVSDPLQRRGRGRARAKHLGAYNPLDDLEPEPPAPKARVSLRVTADLLEVARDAAAFLSEAQGRVTLGDLAEDALRAELQRLAVEHNAGRPFPARPGEPKGGRGGR